MIRALALTLSLGLVACSQDPAPAPIASPLAKQEAALVTAFPTGTLIIPMDTTSQNNGTLRAFGLVDRLLRANVPVQRVSLTGKAVGAIDFSAAVNQQEGGAALGTVAYRAGPFLVSAADVTPAVLTLVEHLPGGGRRDQRARGHRALQRRRAAHPGGGPAHRGAARRQ